MSKIFTPKNEAELAKIIAKANDDKTTLNIVGGGTRQGLGVPVKADAILSLEKISGITLYEAGAMTLVAKAGTPLSEIEMRLREKNQRLAFEPADYRKLYNSKGEPTIGAIVACNISGSRRVFSGACRDALIGVRFVNGKGEIIKSGGRVMKNVTGLDLVKLLAGSYGTLGVLSEVSFKVLPIAERRITIAINGLSSKEAVNILAQALGSPFEISGAAHIPNNEISAKSALPKTLIRLEGFDKSLTYRIEKIQKTFLKNLNIEIIEGEKHDDLWRSITNVEMFKNSKKPLWKISIKPSNAPDIEKAIKAITKAKFLFDWGGGLIWVEVENEKTANAKEIREIISQYGGHATLIRGSKKLRLSVPVFQPQAKPLATLSKSIRQKFDPNSILNPNIMGL